MFQPFILAEFGVVILSIIAYPAHMKWTTMASALGQPIKACFDLTSAERRLLLGVLILFCIGLAAREIHRRNARSTPYSPPLEQVKP
ncbi:MAG: hypothetical protein PHO14_08890 [Kiritimatiellae bacterium]|nr:hypothetical protein [Kiritimatiellia bacterium]MDD4342332.1 hypothetical protein [Kiritimatiellia bacterium]MDY0148814.1 hypothetical protein [Kiritimatiellia bacterium]